MAAVNHWPARSAFIGGAPVLSSKENDCRHAVLIFCDLFGDLCTFSEPPKECDFYDCEDTSL